MAYRQYTHCVQPADYKYPLPPTSNALEVIGAVLDGLAGGYLNDALAACDYLLGGKLVCLGGDRCAIGRITHFEPASDKSFPGNIDNDFSFNILLAPQDLSNFAGNSWDANKAFAKAGIQGILITEQPSMPVPAESAGSVTFTDYPTNYPDSSYISYNPNDSPFQVPGSAVGYQVPTLHLECEGSRINDVCSVLSTFTLGPLTKAACSIPIIGFFVCHVLGLLLLPVFLTALLAAVAIAWAAADDGNQADARIDGKGGDLHFGDLVVVYGRWVYDAGHTGWNEFHPVKSIQQIDEQSYAPGNFGTFLQQWCRLVSQVPPVVPVGVVPVGMTPQQQTIYAAQQQPENQWILHPAIDGCLQSDTGAGNIR